MHTKKGKKNTSKKEKQEEIFEDIHYESEEGTDEISAVKNKLKKLRVELKKEKEKSQEYLLGWQKERASFANYKTQEEEKRKDRIKNMKLDLVMDFFPVLDSFDMAFANKDAWEKVDAAWRTGVEYIHSQLLKVLENYQIQAIDEIDIAFNPQIHAPVETIETDDEKKNDTIAAIVQKGYRSGELVLRPAKVKVFNLKNK